MNTFIPQIPAIVAMFLITFGHWNHVSNKRNLEDNMFIFVVTNVPAGEHR